jgi:hypothetical protein
MDEFLYRLPLKWKLRVQEAPAPRESAPIYLNADDSDDASRNKWIPDGRRQVKLEVKRRVEQEKMTKKWRKQLQASKKLFEKKQINKIRN